MYNQIYNTSKEFLKSLKANKKYSFLVKNWNAIEVLKGGLRLKNSSPLICYDFFLHVKDLKSFPILALFMQILFVRTVYYPDALRRGC